MSALPQDAPRGFVAKADYYAALRRIDELEAELREAREAQAKALGQQVLLRVWNALRDLSHMEAALVAYLYQTPCVATNDALYGVGSNWRRSDTALDTHALVKTHIHSIRRRLDAAGAPQGAIRTFRGVLGTR